MLKVLRAPNAGGSTGRAPSRALPGVPPLTLSILRSTPQSTPISQSTPTSTSRSTSRDFPISTPVPGQGDCNPWSEKTKGTLKIMRCAKGIFAKWILGCAGLSLLRCEKGSETPSCGGEKGLRLPRSWSMRSEHEERGSLRPVFPSQEGSQTLFPTAKGKTPYIPKPP